MICLNKNIQKTNDLRSNREWSRPIIKHGMNLSIKYLNLFLLLFFFNLHAQKNIFEFSVGYIGDKNLNANIPNLGELLPAPNIDNRLAFQLSAGYEKKLILKYPLSLI